MIRLTVHFTGRVQGVGFRMTTCRIASGHAVTGTVMNLPDGRVRCVVEGQPAEVHAFLAELRQVMARHITDQQVDTAPATGQFEGFRIG